ncbi:MAG: SpoIIE family protein phosphatase [Marinilabiliaceae bacterium]|nr:SpoIIE family protein phosphatase [Marinilabiliaceae bacterium]
MKLIRKITAIILLLAPLFVVMSCHTDKKIDHTVYYHTAETLCNMSRIDNARPYIDSIKILIPQYPDAEIYASALEAWCFMCEKNMPQSTRYAIEALNKIENDTLGRFNCNELLSDLSVMLSFNYLSSNNDSVIYFAEKCYNLHKTNNSSRATKHSIEACLYMAEALKNSHNFEACIDKLQIIQNMCDTTALINSDPTWMLYILSESSKIATMVGDYRRSNNYLQDASKLYDKGTLFDKLLYLYHRAYAHLYQNQYTLATYYSTRLRDLAIAYNSPSDERLGYVVEGLTACRIGNIKRATDCCRSADSIESLYPNKVQEIFEKLLLDGELAAYQGDYSKAKELLFSLPQSNKMLFDQLSLLESQQKYYLTQNDFKSIYEIEQRKQRYIDSIQTNVIYSNEIKQAKREKASAEEMRIQIQAQESTIDNYKSTVIFERIFFIFLVTIVAIGIVLAIRRNDARNNRRIEVEKKRLEKEIQSKVKELEHQAEMLQKTNNRISESVTYAERIQHSILPLPNDLEKYDIEGSFIFLSPLDVVSGDFYWFTQKGDNLILACADCTGHGIPGAFMSMIASTILNDIVKTAPDNILPSRILEDMDTMLIDILTHNTSETGAANDGLDIALVSINLKTLNLTASAARRPVIIIKDQEIITMRGQKRSIGDADEIVRCRKFVDETYQLHRGDTIYLFSDGYSDQFGGPEGEKMKSTKIKRFLRAIHNDDMDEQCLTVQELFTQWKGDYPQTDDVLFIGIKL